MQRYLPLALAFATCVLGGLNFCVQAFRFISVVASPFLVCVCAHAHFFFHAGAFLGFRKGSTAYSKILPMWLSCAMDKACIAPEGSSRRNHRQDQSSLTLLTKVYLHAARGCTPLRSDLTIRFWRDIYYEASAATVNSRRLNA